LSGHNQQLTSRGSALAAMGIGAAIVAPLALTAGPVLAIAWEGICLLG